jgi:hypothetical protein
MKELENQTYLVWYLIANALAIVMLITAWKQPKIARLLFFMLFAWACKTNWTTVMNIPNVYIEYAELTFLALYKKIILGWFSSHIVPVVATIATCQGLIAISMLLKGLIYKIGLIGGILFLVAIVPFGIGSGFPSTLIMAIAMYMLLKDSKNYIWHRGHQPDHKAVNDQHVNIEGLAEA